MLKKQLIVSMLVLIALSFSVPAGAGWMDVAKEAAKEAAGSPSSSTTSNAAQAALSDSDVITGLKEALGKAIGDAIASLGKPDGYLSNLDVKIPMPDNLQTAEKAARAIGQDELADQFIGSMNSAAEQAVPETVAIFSDAIKNMSFDDARGILNGPDDAATSFFKTNSSTALFEKILPLVEKTTDSVGVTSKYKSMMSGVTALGAAAGMETKDLDSYVTDKAIAGLFSVMALEEKKIRENPAQRTTDILKKVFGTLD